MIRFLQQAPLKEFVEVLGRAAQLVLWQYVQPHSDSSGHFAEDLLGPDRPVSQVKDHARSTKFDEVKSVKALNQFLYAGQKQFFQFVVPNVAC